MLNTSVHHQQPLREARPHPHRRLVRPPLLSLVRPPLVPATDVSGSLRVRKVAPLAESYVALRRALRARYQSDSIDGVAKYLHDASLFYDSPRHSAEYAEARELVTYSLRVHQLCGPEALGAFLRYFHALEPIPGTPTADDIFNSDEPITLQSATIGTLLARAIICYRRAASTRSGSASLNPMPTSTQRSRCTSYSNASEYTESPLYVSSPARQVASHRVAGATTVAPTPLAGPDAASIASAFVLAPSRLASVAARVVAAALVGFNPLACLRLPT